MIIPLHVNDGSKELLGISILNCFFELKEFKQRLDNSSLNYDISEIRALLKGMYNILIQSAMLHPHIKNTAICLKTITKLSKTQRSKLC